MRKYPTPWQYLVDIVAQSRLKAAYASNNAKTIKQAEAYYKGLTEDEVVFSTPFKNPNTGKWVVSMTSHARGFKLADVNFNTGSLIKMVGANASHMATHDSLETSTVTGFYYSEEAEQNHLLVHPDSNIHEALKMTGYEFSPENYAINLYPERDGILKADGEVDISHPVVAGKVFISYVQRPVESAPQSAPFSVEGVDETILNGGPVAEGFKLETEMTQEGEALPPAEGVIAQEGEEPKEATEEVAKEEVQEEQPAAETNQPKNKRR